MEPTTTLQLGFLKIPTLALGVAGSVAVHATMLLAFNTVWIDDMPATQLSAEPAFAQGQSIQVRLKSTAQPALEPDHPAPTSRLLMHVAEPQDIIRGHPGQSPVRMIVGYPGGYPGQSPVRMIVTLQPIATGGT